MPARAQPSPASPGGPLDKPLLALHKAMTGDAAIKAAIALVRRALPCDFVGVFLRIEPHAYGPVGYKLVDSRGRDFSAELVDGRFFENHPAAPILMANPGIRFINTRDVLPPDEILHSSKFYREVMQVIGFRHSVAIYFWSEPAKLPPEVVVAPSRGETGDAFSDAEIALLDHLYPHLQAAFRRVQAIDRERAVREELRRLIDCPVPACVLHWDLTVAEANRGAREMCARWNHGAASTRLKLPPFRLPPVLRDACEELKQRWSASLAHRPATGAASRLTIRHVAEPAIAATVSVHMHHGEPLGKPPLLIEFSSPALTSAHVAPNSNGLTLKRFSHRERELIEFVRAGQSNQEIADATGKALGTVKNALHAIFAKAGVRSRSALIAHLEPARK